MASSNEAVPPPHASLRRRRHSRSLASLLCPQPPGFLRLDSLARYAVAAVKGLAAAVEAATAVAVSAAAASAWYAGQVEEIPVPMPGYTLKLHPAPTRLSGVLRLLLVSLCCSLAARVRNAVREEAFRRGRLQLTREGLRNVYGSDGKLRSTLLLSPFKVGGGGSGSGGGGGASGAAAVSNQETLPAPASSTGSMTLVDMVEELFEAVLGKGSKGTSGGKGAGEASSKKRVGDVADDLRRVCEAVGLPFRPEVEGANVSSLRAAATRCREEVFGKGK